MDLMNNLRFFNQIGKRMQPTKTLYFLDLNILIKIEKYNQNPHNFTDLDLKIIKELKNIDNEFSIITIITSAIEGRSGDIQKNIEVINSQVNNYFNQLDKFFKKAIVDKSILDESLNTLLLDAITSDETKDSLKIKNNFLDEIMPIIKEIPLSEKNRMLAQNKILEIAIKYNLNEWNLMIIYCLYIIFNSSGKKIIKINDKTADKVLDNYNSIMDFQHLNLFFAAIPKLHNKYSNKYCANIVCEFKTNDKALKSFLDFFDLDLIKSSEYKNDAILTTIDFENVDKFNNFLEHFPKKLAEFYRKKMIQQA